MNLNNLYQWLFELLVAPQGAVASSAAASIAGDRASRRDVLSVARKEGCLPEVLAAWDAAGQLSPSESVELDRLRRKRAGAADVLRALPAGALLAGTAGAQRFPVELEVLLPDLAALGPLHEAVRRLGYRLRGAGHWHVPARDPMHRGLASLHYGTATAYESAVAIAVHVGGVPVDERRNLPVAELADKAVRLDGLACRGLEPTRRLLRAVAAFGARAEPVTVREIADLHALLAQHGQRIDFAWLHRRIEQAGLWHGLAQLREAVVARRLGGLVAWGAFGRLIDASPARAAAAAARAARAPRLGTLVRDVLALVPGPREDDLGARAARLPWLVGRVLDAGYRVQGVPVPSRGVDTPRYVRIDGALYLATGAGLILLSLVDLTDGARAALGERVRTAGRPVVLARWSGARARAASR